MRYLTLLPKISILDTMYRKMISILLITVTGLAGCHTNDIRLQKGDKTSDRLECDKVFAESRKAIVEMNEILVQTGAIDILGDTMVRAAIIYVNDREEVVRLVKTEKAGSVSTETYSGKEYKVILHYEPYKVGYITAYKGDIEVWKGNLYSKLSVEGLRNRL